MNAGVTAGDGHDRRTNLDVIRAFIAGIQSDAAANPESATAHTSSRITWRRLPVRPAGVKPWVW